VISWRERYLVWSVAIELLSLSLSLSLCHVLREIDNNEILKGSIMIRWHQVASKDEERGTTINVNFLSWFSWLEVAFCDIMYMWPQLHKLLFSEKLNELFSLPQTCQASHFKKAKLVFCIAYPHTIADLLVLSIAIVIRLETISCQIHLTGSN
jgi:hypothetical protein